MHPKHFFFATSEDWFDINIWHGGTSADWNLAQFSLLS
jgi:hypothetical protein